MIRQFLIRLRGRNRAAKLRHPAADLDRIRADQRELQSALDRWNRTDAAASAFYTHARSLARR